MQPPPLAHFSPLHMGRSFICYRDVNKAIDRHREIYGLRLVLKKAVKLENYCLTIDQMRDLNFRLKYGELDYQCSVDNGRPGRPGNDERCPRLVRLRLSPDARTLVVYDTHVHEPQAKSPGQFQSLSPPSHVPESVTVISPEALVSISPVNRTGTPSTPCLPLSISPVGVTPEGPHTPVSGAGYEKITVKIKKSQFSPNEMVVVGSARDAQEQFELSLPIKGHTPNSYINSPEKVSTQTSTPNPGIMQIPALKPLSKDLSPQFLESVTASKVVRRPTPKPLDKVTIKPVEKVASKSVEKVIIKPVERILNKSSEREEVKAVERQVIKTVEKVTIKPQERLPARVPERTATKPLERTGTRQAERSTARVPGRLSQRTTERVSQRNGGTLSTAAGNGVSSSTNGVRSVNGGSNRRMHKKKRTCQSEPTWDLSQIVPLDTELGFTEKQQLAHGVLLRLLRVTSQLPMIEFTHALETLETLTDAYQLEQRVNLSISHNREEESNKLYNDDPYEIVDLVDDDAGEFCEYGNNRVSSTTVDHRVAVTQVDGPNDDVFDNPRDVLGPKCKKGQKRSSSADSPSGVGEETQNPNLDSVQMWKISRSSS
ncbi:uncharacterized protein [Procambarus clarkii]|uniref:uncharacterized protein isoform X1 n=1 Tax=Procambarus clarkii TaxID=6728 RepID=UPI003742FA77